MKVKQMGILKKNENGTYTFEGGFSTKNPEDMKQLKNLVGSQFKAVEKPKKEIKKEVSKEPEYVDEELLIFEKEKPRKEIKEEPKKEKPTVRKTYKRKSKGKRVKR